MDRRENIGKLSGLKYTKKEAELVEKLIKLTDNRLTKARSADDYQSSICDFLNILEAIRPVEFTAMEANTGKIGRVQPDEFIPFCIKTKVWINILK